MQDGRYQLVTAVVQLLLERQRQHDHIGTSASSVAATDAVEKAIADQSNVSCPREAPTPSQVLPRRPAATALGCKMLRGLIAKDTVPTKPALPPDPRPAEPARGKQPPQRSNAAILQLAHTLIASHSSPNREETYTAELPAATLTKKPAVPRVRRPTSGQASNGCLDTTRKGAAFDLSSSSNRGTTATTTANRPALPARKRPAWAQLAEKSPAEQEEALLDWVTHVDDPLQDEADAEQRQDLPESPDMLYSAA